MNFSKGTYLERINLNEDLSKIREKLGDDYDVIYSVVIYGTVDDAKRYIKEYCNECTDTCTVDYSDVYGTVYNGSGCWAINARASLCDVDKLPDDVFFYVSVECNGYAKSFIKRGL